MYNCRTLKSINVQQKYMFIFTEIWNRWATEVELNKKKYYLLTNPVHILAMLWQSSIHLLKDKNPEWSNF